MTLQLQDVLQSIEAIDDIINDKREELLAAYERVDELEAALADAQLQIDQLTRENA